MLSDPRIIYGIHTVVPYNRATSEPYGILKVLGSSQLSLSAEFEELFGGSQSFTWAVEPKNISSEFTMNVKTMPDFLFEQYLGATISTTAASATGSVSTLTNVFGSSCVSATVGIASVALKSGEEADLKSGKYIVRVISSTTVDVFHTTDLEHKVGADLEYQDDLGKITETALTIPDAAGNVSIPNTGLEFTSGSGTVNMANTGDTAEFYVSSIHGGLSEITIGASGMLFPAHGLYIVAAKGADGSTFEMEIFKAVGAGFPIGFQEMAFAITDLTIKPSYDSAKDAFAKIRAKKGV